MIGVTGWIQEMFYDHITKQQVVAEQHVQIMLQQTARVLITPQLIIGLCNEHILEDALQ